MEDESILWRRTVPPENELPVVLPWSALLGRTDSTAAALTGVEVHTTGAVLRIAVRSRGDAPHRLRPDPDALVGVELADGGVAVGTTSPSRQPLRPDGPALHLSLGSRFGPDAADLGFLLTPLPPPGPLTLYYAWVAGGIPETSVRLDATETVEAAARVRVLWEREPGAAALGVGAATGAAGGWVVRPRHGGGVAVSGGRRVPARRAPPGRRPGRPRPAGRR